MPRESEKSQPTVKIPNGCGRRRAGRKCLLTPELIEQCRIAFESHSSISVTCELAGISRDTFYRWLKEGEVSDTGLKRDFYDAVTRARAMSVIVLTHHIANDPSWQAKAWLLERLHPKEWGRRKVIVYVAPENDEPRPSSFAFTVNISRNQRSHP